MQENDKIKDGLEKAFEESSNLEDKLKIMDRLNTYNSNENERKKNEAKQRLDQNVHDDELVKLRDRAAIDEKHFRWQKAKDIAAFSWTVFMGMMSLGIMAKAAQDDHDGKPWWGIMKTAQDALWRKWPKID